MKRTLLLDGDVFAYQAAAASETVIPWCDEVHTVEGNLSKARALLESSIDRIMRELNGDDYVVALSDIQIDESSQSSFNVYWRRDVLPTYKNHRKGVRKPIVLRPLREWMIESLPCKLKPRLEGDDVLGVLATHPTLIKGEKVIVSIDKDMKTIPGLFYRNLNDKAELVDISEYDADYNHMFQTLTGDTTDGYAGCPGIGPVSAVKILEGWETKPNPREFMWSAVVKAFEKAKLNEAQAIIQARVARICRHTDYDFKKKEPILWIPPVRTEAATSSLPNKTT